MSKIEKIEGDKLILAYKEDKLNPNSSEKIPLWLFAPELIKKLNEIIEWIAKQDEK